MRIAQLSDLHLLAAGKRGKLERDPAEWARGAIEAVNTMVPEVDLVVISGDLTHDESPGAYDAAGELLSDLRPDFRVIPGNHDDRNEIRSRFRSHGYESHSTAEGAERGESGAEFLQLELRLEGWRILLLDTKDPGVHSGMLCSTRLSWIEARLADDPELPTILFSHHPPFDIGVAGLDAYGLRGSDRLADIVRRYPCVRRIASGHVHRPVAALWAGIPATTAPSTLFGFRLDLASDARPSVVDEPCGIQLHVLESPDTIVTHMVYTEKP